MRPSFRVTMRYSLPDNPFNHPSVQSLRAIFGAAPKDEDVEYAPIPEDEGSIFDYPKVPVPPDFRHTPFVTGSPEFARMTENMFDIIPEARGYTSNVFQGPSSMMIRRDDPFIEGIASAGSGNIEINPDLQRNEAGTLAHELYHTTSGGGYSPDLNEAAARMIYGTPDSIWGGVPEELRTSGYPTIVRGWR